MTSSLTSQQPALRYRPRKLNIRCNKVFDKTKYKKVLPVMFTSTRQDNGEGRLLEPLKKF